MAASTPRKATARKTTTTSRRKTVAKRPVDLGLVLDDDAARAEVDALITDREPLFTIGGTTYTIPKRVPPSWSMKAFKIATERGEAEALAFAAERLLTDEAWEALQECETVTPSSWEKILNALVDRILPDGVLGPKA